MELQDSTEEMDDYEAEILFASLDEYCSLPAGVVHDPFHIFEGFRRRDSPTSDGSESYRSESSRTTDELKRHHDGEQKIVRLSRPRILKNDFRRQYANMWVNVFNSCDRELMQRHLDTYYDRNVVVTQNDVREDHTQCPQKIPFYQQSARGVDYLAQFWYAGMSAAPDMACSLRHTFVKVRSDGSSVIRCCFALKGTQVSDLDPHSRESIEKIARYQAYKAAGRRGITITEAAVAAVAPTTVNLSRNRSVGSGGSSPKGSVDGRAAAMSVPATSTGGASLDRKRDAGATTAAPPALPVPAINIKQESPEPRPPSLPMAGSGQQRSMPRSSGVPMSVDTVLDPAVPVRAGGGTNRESPTASGASTSSSGTASVGNSNTSAAAKSDINWLAMAEYAYSAGTLEPCQPQAQKKYFYSGDTSANVSNNHSSAASPRERSADDQLQGPPSRAAEQAGRVTGAEERAGSLTQHGKLVTQNDMREMEMTEDSDVDSLTEKMSRTVITAAIDCICAIELEMNPDNIITSVVLHYFR